MRILLLSPVCALLALALVGCGGAGEADFHPNTSVSSARPEPVTGEFYQEAASATGNGTDISVSISAKYNGEVSGNASSFLVPVTISQGTTVIYTGEITFNQDSVATSNARNGPHTAAATVLTDADYFGTISVPFDNLPDGTFDITISFPPIAGADLSFALVPLDLSIPIPLTTTG